MERACAAVRSKSLTLPECAHVPKQESLSAWTRTRRNGCSVDWLQCTRLTIIAQACSYQPIKRNYILFLSRELTAYASWIWPLIFTSRVCNRTMTANMRSSQHRPSTSYEIRAPQQEVALNIYLFVRSRILTSTQHVLYRHHLHLCGACPSCS